jgi:N-acyl-D-aspartate deacylase
MSPSPGLRLHSACTLLHSNDNVPFKKWWRQEKTPDRPRPFLHFARSRSDVGRRLPKLTFMVASIFGLPDRGLLRRGMAADLCVFDPATVRECDAEMVQDLAGTRNVSYRKRWLSK